MNWFKTDAPGWAVQKRGSSKQVTPYFVPPIQALTVNLKVRFVCGIVPPDPAFQYAYFSCISGKELCGGSVCPHFLAHEAEVGAAEGYQKQGGQASQVGPDKKDALAQA